MNMSEKRSFLQTAAMIGGCFELFVMLPVWINAVPEGLAKNAKIMPPAFYNSPEAKGLFAMFLIMLGLHRLSYAFTRAPTRNSWLCLVAVHVLEACGFWALATRPHFQTVAASAGATDSVLKLAMLAPLELIVVPLQAVFYLLNAPAASAKPHSQ